MSDLLCKNIDWEKILLAIVPTIPPFIAVWASDKTTVEIKGENAILNIAGKIVTVNVDSFLNELYVNSDFKIIGPKNE